MGLLIDGFRADRGQHRNSDPLKEAGERMANGMIKAAHEVASQFASGNSISDRYHNNRRIGVAVIDAGVVPSYILLVADGVISEITFQDACVWREKIYAADAVDALVASEDAKAKELAKATEEGYTLDVRAIAEELGVSVLDGSLDGVPVNQVPTIAGLYPQGKQLVFATVGGRGRGRWMDYVEYDIATKKITKYSVRNDGAVQRDDGDDEPIVIKATERLSNNPFAVLREKLEV